MCLTRWNWAKSSTFCGKSEIMHNYGLKLSNIHKAHCVYTATWWWNVCVPFEILDSIKDWIIFAAVSMSILIWSTENSMWNSSQVNYFTTAFKSFFSIEQSRFIHSVILHAHPNRVFVEKLQPLDYELWHLIKQHYLNITSGYSFDLWIVTSTKLATEFCFPFDCTAMGCECVPKSTEKFQDFEIIMCENSIPFQHAEQQHGVESIKTCWKLFERLLKTQTTKFWITAPSPSSLSWSGQSALQFTP